MNAKALGILVAAAVVLAVLAIVGQNRDSADPIAGTGSPLLPGLAGLAETVDEIAIDGAGDQRLVTLNRRDEGWTVAEQDGYAADFAKLRELLVALAEARIVEEMTANAEFHSRLGVESIAEADAAGLAVTLATESGQSYAVVLGAAAGGQRYARRADESRSFLIDRNPDVPRDPADWVVPDIIDVASGRVQRVEIEHADGERLVISKNSRDETNFALDNLPEGRELAYASVANVTGNALRDLRLAAVGRIPEEAAAPSVVTEFWTFDGLVVTAAATADGDAEGTEPWVRFSARYEPEQAEAYAQAAAASEDAGEEGAANRETTGAVEAEAAAINARLAGWRFRIPSYQYDQMARRMEDLLAAAETDGE